MVMINFFIWRAENIGVSAGFVSFPQRTNLSLYFLLREWAIRLGASEQ
jgi:uncharacterized membrane protein YoaT (DUF817 family)